MAWRVSKRPSAFQSRNMDGCFGSYGFGIEMEPLEYTVVSGTMVPSVRAPEASRGFTIDPGV